MTKAKKIKQIHFETKNKVGILSTVTTALSSARVNIKAICAYGMDKKSYFMLVTSNNAKAIKVLAKMKTKAVEDDVIAVEMPTGAGQLKKAAIKISNAGIDILYMYGSVGAGKNAVCIFKTENNNKALKTLSNK